MGITVNMKMTEASRGGGDFLGSGLALSRRGPHDFLVSRTLSDRQREEKRC
jgi:hypothetical protein